MASLNKKTTKIGQKSGVKTATAKSKPAILEQVEKMNDIRDILEAFGLHGLCAECSTYWGRANADKYFYSVRDSGFANEYSLRPVNKLVGSLFVPYDSGKIDRCGRNSAAYYVYEIPVAYVSDDAAVWASMLKVEISGDLKGTYNASRRYYVQEELEIKKGASLQPFKLLTKFDRAVVPIQTDKALLNIILSSNKFAYDFVCKNDVAPLNFLMAPYLETLHKAGYAFAQDFFGRGIKPNDADCLNRLCKRGSNPAEIFKTSKAVYKVLGPSERNMTLWDTYRKMDKFGRITQETIRQSYDHAMSIKNLDLIYQILGQTYNGKPLFDWDSLYNYLVRLDKFEAIGNDEALLLLRDYLNMCRQLGMRPRTDGDSLKREHDVAARLCLNLRHEELDRQMEPACQRLSKYDYNEGVYFIRCIKGFEDLLSEATQQHSCLVSYGRDIANGLSNIFVMREVTNPDRSLITVELSIDRKTITQALTAYNKGIRNKSQREFLDRWLRYVKDVDRYSA